MKRVLIISGVLLGLLVLGVAYNIFSFRSAMRGMETIDSGPIEKGVFAVKSNISNLFIVASGTEAICIDAGADLNQTREELKKLKIAPESIRAVFLTHSDGDHVGAIELFSNATIYISADEEQMINGNTVRKYIFKNKVPFTEYQLLGDGEHVRIGDICVQAIATPGHTTGSMSYRVNDEILFTGDTLGLKDGKVTLSPSFFNMDEESEKLSIQKIAQLEGVKLVCTSHYGTNRDFKSAFEDWR
jgi:hydroxyacylglutathione hydrolase